MDKYLDSFREMISLRGLTDHTLKNYCTYLRAYLDYLELFLRKLPEDVSWADLRDFVRWLQKDRTLSDRTMNCVISQIRFFTIYVLHKPWDETQLPFRKFDSFLPFVPSKLQVLTLIDSMTDFKVKAMTALAYSSGLRIGEVCHLRNDPAKPIDTFFLSRHIHNQERLLGWEPRITCHSLRHAFGTHLYKDGADLLTIKALLGHKSLYSTTLYVHQLPYSNPQLPACLLIPPRLQCNVQYDP